MESALHLRAVGSGDASLRAAALNSEHVSRGILIDVPVSVEGTEAWIQRVAVDVSRRDFCLVNADEVLAFVGLVNIQPLHRTCELYVFTLPSTRGKGLGRHATELALDYAKVELGLRKVSLYVSAPNRAAISLYEQLGFHVEGTLRAHAWHRGAFVDRLIYSRFLDDWHANAARLYQSLA